MRYRTPAYGESRVKRWFAIFPVLVRYSIGDEIDEWRWLEYVTVRQIYRDGWVNREFIDE